MIMMMIIISVLIFIIVIFNWWWRSECKDILSSDKPTWMWIPGSLSRVFFSKPLMTGDGDMMEYNLVGGLVAIFFFPYIGLLIIPID